MAIPSKSRTNKFDCVVDEVNRGEESAKLKSEKVVKAIAGHAGKTRTIVDKNGRTREVKVAEKRKVLPVYIPESLYEKFDAITTAYGKSNNSAIVEMIRDYVTEKKSILEEL